MATIQPSDDSPAFVDFDEFVAYQLGEVKSAVRSTDLTTAIVGSFAWISALCAAFVITDQWLFTDGWSMVARWIWLVMLTGGLACWFSRTLLHPLLRKVSPLYAAKELETAVPALRRNLVNLVDLQTAGRPVAPAVLKALQKRAAVSLEEVQPRQAIDHTHLLWASCALLAAVVLLAVYAVVSPKPIWPSLWRMIPFTAIDVPTETLIREVNPGSTSRLAGSILDVEVQLAGRIPELVELKFTTVDQQFVDETVRMVPVGQGGTRFEARLLGERGEGFTQSFSYYVQAGDARSAIYHVSVVTPPHANVEEVEVQAPGYTGIEKQVSRGGAIHAWVGSDIKIRAVANQAVASATMLFFDDDGMTPTGEEIPVRLSQNRELFVDYRPQLREDGTYSRYYSIVVRTAAGESDPSPTIYPLALQIDQPPEIRMALPENDVVTAANATVGFVFVARDPDFLLGPMTLIAEKQGQIIAREEMAAGGVSQLTAKTALRLDRFALQENDELRVYATVQDNRQPTPNTARSDARMIRIQGVLPPQKRQEQQKQAEEQAKQVEEQARQKAAQNPAGNEPPQEPPQQEPGEGQEAMPERPQEGEGNPGQNGPAQPNGNRTGEGMNRDNQQPRENTSASDNPQNANGNPGEESANPSDSNMTEDKASSGRTGENKDASRKPNRDPGAESSPENSSADSLNQSGSKAQSGSNPQNSQQQKSGSSGSNKATPNEPSGKSEQGLSPNGEDDSEALKRLMQKASQNQKPSSQPESAKTPESNKSSKDMETPGRENESRPENAAEDPSSNSSPNDRTPSDPAGKNRNQAGQPMDQKSGSEDKSNTTEDRPSGNEPSKSQAGQSDSPREEMTAPEEGNAGQKPSTAEKQADRGTSGKEAGEKSKAQPAGGDSQLGDPSEKNSQEPGASSEMADPKAKRPPNAGASSANNSKSNDAPAGEQNSPAADPGMTQPSNQSREGTTSSEKPSDRRRGQDGTKGNLEADHDRPENMPAGQADPSAASPKDAPGATRKVPTGEKPAADSQPKATSPEDGRSMDREPQKTDMPGEAPQQSPNQQPAARPNSDSQDVPAGTGEKMRGEPGKQPKANQKSQQAESGEAGRSAANPDGADGMAEGSGNDTSSERAKPGEAGRPGAKEASAGNGSDAAQKSGSRPAEGGSQPASQQKTGGNDQPQDGASGGMNSPTGEKNGSQPADQSPLEKGGSSKPGNSQEMSAEQNGKETPSGEGNPGNPGGNPAGSPAQGKNAEASQGGKGGEAGPNGGQGGSSPASGTPTSGGPSSADPSGQASSASGGGGSGEMTPRGASSAKGNENAAAGGKDGSERPAANGPSATESGETSNPNSQFEKEAAELVLDQLERQLERGEVDQKLLDDLGWNEQQMRSFAKRMREQINASRATDPTPEDLLRKRQFEEMLESAKLSRQNVEAQGKSVPQRDIDQAGSRRSKVPEQYRQRFEAYTRGVQKKSSTPAPTPPSSSPAAKP